MAAAPHRGPPAWTAGKNSFWCCRRCGKHIPKRNVPNIRAHTTACEAAAQQLCHGYLFRADGTMVAVSHAERKEQVPMCNTLEFGTWVADTGILNGVLPIGKLTLPAEHDGNLFSLPRLTFREPWLAEIKAGRKTMDGRFYLHGHPDPVVTMLYGRFIVGTSSRQAVLLQKTGPAILYQDGPLRALEICGEALVPLSLRGSSTNQELAAMYLSWWGRDSRKSFFVIPLRFVRSLDLRQFPRV